MVYENRFFLLLTVTIFFISVSVQGLAHNPPPAQKTTGIQLPSPRGSNPKPEDAVTAILAAFDKYEVVAMSAAHDNKEIDDFILHLVRNPTFPRKVNDIVVECGNSLYQPILDRYIAGEDLPLSEVWQVWRNTTQAMCGESAFYENLFPLVRRINQKLPPELKLRMLAADPPIDWSKVESHSDMGVVDRDDSISSVMEKEVLSKHRKALMLFGIGHLWHGGSLAVGRYEKEHPGVTLVIADHMGFNNCNDELEAWMASWPVPSLVQHINGTWLADLDVTYFSTKVDAYLYLGPRDLLLRESKPAEISMDRDYMAELRRRAAIMGGGRANDQGNAENPSSGDSSPFLYDEYRNILESAGINASQPCPLGRPQAANPHPNSIHLSQEVLKTFAGEYSVDLPSEVQRPGVSVPHVEITVDQEGLFVDDKMGGKGRFVPLSPKEFFDTNAPSIRITFTMNEKGQITGLVVSGVGPKPIHANRLP